MPTDYATLKEKLITEARKLARDKRLVLTNPDISESARQKRLTEIPQQFETASKDVLKQYGELSTNPSSHAQRSRKTTTVSEEALSELKELLADANDPVDAVLDVLSRGTAETVAALASDKGQKLVEKQLRKGGEEESTVTSTLKALSTAAQKRAAQHDAHLQPASEETETASTESRFWGLAFGSFQADVLDAFSTNKRAVVFPATPGSNEQPTVIALDGRESNE